MYYLIFAVLFCFSLGLNAQTDNYQIQRGDVLDIAVMEHPEFSVNNVIVLPDGNVQFPALGFIKVAGKSSTALSDTFQVRLLKYVVDPIVTVYVRKINNQYVNILGAVNKPGQYQIFEPIKVMSAISLAGGFRSVQKLKTISIIRINGEREEVKVDNFMETPEMFAALKPGDTIYIEPKKDFNWSKLTFVSSLLYLVISIINLTN
jgi:polysaccharide export outer membrane protein